MAESNPFQESLSFSKEYFSGARVQIYFGDTFIEEATSLQYTLTETVVPIYGFASYTWDRVARGTRMVQGSFTINFTEAGYLQTVLDRLSNKMNSAKGISTGVKAEDIGARYEVRGNLEGMTLEQLLNAEKKDFDDIMTEYENSIWGGGTLEEDFRNRSHDTYFYPQNVEMKNTSYNREMRQDGFNIMVDFGKNMDLGRIKCFAGLGDKEMNDIKTRQSIRNVQLTSVGKMIAPDGQAVQEQYSFIAKDIDGVFVEKI